jgi:type VI secretion system protein ImpL
VVAAYGTSGGPGALCQQAAEGHYPFRTAAQNEVPIDDFTRLFAPGGLLDGYINTQLRPFVNMSARSWQPQEVDGVTPPVSAAELTAFRTAATIRDMFFGSNATPSVRFDITPVSLDGGAKSVTLEFSGVAVNFAHGQPSTTQVTWPGAAGMTDVRLRFDPPPSGPPVLQTSGPWALFRMLNQGALRQAGAPDRYMLSFNVGGHQAEFAIHAGSVLNPFNSRPLQEFRCPSLH